MSPERNRFDALDRYGLVLLLIGVTYVVSAANSGSNGAYAVLFVQLATIWLVFRASETKRAQRIAGVAALAVAAVALVVGVFGFARSGHAEPGGLLFATNALLYALAPVVIVIHLARRRVIDLQTFLGAIAAYLLIGMMFAFTYRALGYLDHQPPFFGSNGPGRMSDDLFFSFVTLTTTGYGDLVPAANPGQTLAVIEAVAGQLFLVTAVARVVTAWRPLPPE